MTSGKAAPHQARWKDKPPPTKAWKGRPGRTRAQATAEQDKAAGGPDRRWVDLGDGRRARASVELKVLTKTRRIRAYLRWSDRGSTRKPIYLGEVEHEARRENLAEAWRRAIKGGHVLPEEETPASSWAASRSVRASMRGNRSRDTAPEKLLRKHLHERGVRYRVSHRPMAGVRRTADVAFPGARVAVFVDGCFWHGCPLHCRWPGTNEEFWRDKIEGNRARDSETNRLLEQSGWLPVRVWEHEDSSEAADKIIALVKVRRRVTASEKRASQVTVNQKVGDGVLSAPQHDATVARAIGEQTTTASKAGLRQ
ncbi:MULTISPECIES: very short patch repair endonuclease [Streptomycetaceae]|uniref:very short patch repair endonuclease n=1 Tax=Streptomyces TaxID=1883 RepID=UPI002E281592|nr:MULTISPECIES: very short patch repair endonuclease [Streptomyces]